MSVRTTIFEEIARVATEQKKTLEPLHDDAPLLTIGLDSLCFAILVARLEEKLGPDPFSASDEITLPITLGDLVHFYEHALV
jgi:aryl carrier-like protein